MDVDEAASHGSEPYELLGPIGRLLGLVQVVLKVTILHRRQSNSHTGEVEIGDNVVVVAGLPFGPAGVAIVYSAVGLLLGLPVLYYFAGRRGPVSTADLWIGIFRYFPLWAVSCGTTYVMRLLFANSAPLVQLVVCAPVGLIAGVILICTVTPMRRVARGLVDIFRELKSRVSSNTK